MLTLPIDAVPDITNNQVQIVTVSPTLAPQEVEQLITFPIEIAMSNIMNVEEIRSVSRFGLSLVTVVFKESVPTLDARQLINEQIQAVSGEIPSELGMPELMPITTGLGEIYQYILKVAPGYEKKYDAMELRTIQDWIVKRQLSGIPGIVEINSFGGYLKQYEVAVDPDALYSLNITIGEVFEALNRNNQNTGGSYIEKVNRAYYIRSEGMISRTKDIERIVITNRGGIPIHISDVGDSPFRCPEAFWSDDDGWHRRMCRRDRHDAEGSQCQCGDERAGSPRGKGTEDVTGRDKRRALFESVGVGEPEYLDCRQESDRRRIDRVYRSDAVFGECPGGIDCRFGDPVGDVVRIHYDAPVWSACQPDEFGGDRFRYCCGRLDCDCRRRPGASLHPPSGRPDAVAVGNGCRGRSRCGRCRTERYFCRLHYPDCLFPNPDTFGDRGEIFYTDGEDVSALHHRRPDPFTDLRADDGLPIPETDDFGEADFCRPFFAGLNKIYKYGLDFCLHHIGVTVVSAFALLAASLLLFTRLGAEFIPTLDEGDFAMQMTLPAGSSLTQSIELSRQAQKVLKDKFPEIKHVVAKIGTAEVPTDPMAVDDADVMIIMKPFKEWTSASSRAEMVEKMKAALEPITGAEFNFSQPIQLRFNELMTGAKADISIKLYGEDMEELYAKAKEASKFVEKVPGASDVIVEQAMGLPQLVVKYDRARIARYGMNIEELNTIIRTAYAGEAAGVVFENERRFDLVVRLDKEKVADLNLDKLFVRTAEGVQIPVGEVANIELVNGPLQINRDATKRRVVIGVNVRDVDIQQVVADIQSTLEKNIKLSPGYYFEYGGQFENLQNAIDTLLIVIPVALSLILLLLFFAFKSVTYTLVVFSTVPLSLIGGIVALWLRGLPFSISAGVGFIALFGVAVLNGILMINHFNDLRKQTKYQMTTNKIITKGCPHLLRPVFLTGLVASLGFVPMAIAKSAGAEVQRPLATVVIGGLIVSTVLTLLVIPVFYRLVNAAPVWWKRMRKPGGKALVLLAAVLLLAPATLQAQEAKVTLDEAIGIALQNHPRLKTASAAVDRLHAARGEAWEVAPTSVSYSWGQINGEYRHDNQMELTQSLGSLLTPFYKNALVSKQVTTSRYYREMVKKEIVAEVKRAWAYYQYALNLCSLYREQNDLASRLQQAGQLR